ncbi:MAG TPA: sigma-54 dependent transcriptional regulator [Thermoanaerobaculaceae bacterium]|nr:sigma-54 dependent transcriptional regulator [Thermoanaerobaculaceae bacterium]HQU33079.1 sigma-54 dependent transcriptional regulator [Thermoanaerobaculaceae bacterium]
MLLVDDDPGLLRTIQVLLEDEGGLAVETAPSGEAALQRLSSLAGIRLVVSDLSMPGMDGIELLRAIRERHAEIPVILMTAFGTVRSAVEAMRLGAVGYLTKPVDPDELLLQVERALEAARLAGEHRRLIERAGDPDSFDILVGESAAAGALRELIARLAAVDSTVLLRGETGTGKELVARLIHRASSRAGAPFVAVNCTAIPGELIESELFGHERGAFTGATAARSGRIAEAEGGTLLLDEVGDMPLALQPKLLRFLQERRARRVGGNRDWAADVRIMAATHRDLERAMADGAFRPDLFHRLNAIPVTVPPLRAHPEDIPALCRHLLDKLARRVGRPAPALADNAARALQRLPFPGNVRELENLLERALVLRSGVAPGSPLTTADLRLPPVDPVADGLPAVALEGGMDRLRVLGEQAERDLIARALAAWPGLSHAEIAARLGTNRRVLELRIEKLGLG